MGPKRVHEAALRVVPGGAGIGLERGPEVDFPCAGPFPSRDPWAVAPGSLERAPSPGLGRAVPTGMDRRACEARIPSYHRRDPTETLLYRGVGAWIVPAVAVSVEVLVKARAHA